jgi:hypothetical protein
MSARISFCLRQIFTGLVSIELVFEKLTIAAFRLSLPRCASTAPRLFHLAYTRLSGQLQIYFPYLFDAGRADRVTGGLEGPRRISPSAA